MQSTTQIKGGSELGNWVGLEGRSFWPWNVSVGSREGRYFYSVRDHIQPIRDASEMGVSAKDDRSEGFYAAIRAEARR